MDQIRIIIGSIQPTNEEGEAMERRCSVMGRLFEAGGDPVTLKRIAEEIGDQDLALTARMVAQTIRTPVRSRETITQERKGALAKLRTLFGGLGFSHPPKQPVLPPGGNGNGTPRMKNPRLEGILTVLREVERERRTGNPPPPPAAEGNGLP